MPPVEIEELDDNYQSPEEHLQQLLKAHQGDAKKLLAFTFGYLNKNTAFFKDPEASKVLARLLRDVTKGVPKPSSTANTAKTSPSAPSVAPASPAPPSKPVERIPTPAASSSRAAAEEEDGSLDGNEAKEDESKGLSPNSGNGATFEHYSWTQTLAEVSVIVPVPKGTKGRDCDVVIRKDSLKVGLKGQKPVLEGKFSKPVKPEECLWSLDNSSIEMTLQKGDRMTWWSCIVEGEPAINISKVEPENSKLSDLDGETRATVEKMMFDQRQKQMGLPTSDESKKQETLRKFMAAHPEMDFSNTKFS